MSRSACLSSPASGFRHAGSDDRFEFRTHQANRFVICFYLSRTGRIQRTPLAAPSVVERMVKYASEAGWHALALELAQAKFVAEH